MKKLFLAAAVGASVFFMACGDDSSSSNNGTDPQESQTEKEGGNSSDGDCFTVPEPNGESPQGCWYTSDNSSVTEFEVTAVGVITRIWTVKDGKVIETIDYHDGNAPMVDDETGLSSLDEALTDEKEGICKKIKTEICKE